MKSSEYRIKKSLFKSFFRKDTCVLEKTLHKNFDKDLCLNLYDKTYNEVESKIRDQLFYNVVINIQRIYI